MNIFDVLKDVIGYMQGDKAVLDHDSFRNKSLPHNAALPLEVDYKSVMTVNSHKKD